MIGRIATLILLLGIGYAIQIYSCLFLTNALDVESVSEKIGAICCILSFFFPTAATFAIVNELIQGGLL